MSKPDTRPPGLFARLRSRPAPAAFDAADMGTCFGLEVSLDQPDEVPVMAAPTPVRRPGWIQRLGRRGKPAA